MRKCLLLQGSCCIGHLASAVCLSPQWLWQSSCRKAVPAEPEPQRPLPPEIPNPAGWMGFAIHCCADSSCFSPRFLLAFLRCKCTPISSGVILLWPAGTLSPPEAPCPASSFSKLQSGCALPAAPQPLVMCPQWDGIFPGPGSGSNLRPILQCFSPIFGCLGSS